ncbi:MAG: redox-regulated ATPase YchF [Blastocatellia bacterium]|jgi:GTP-binding protein YchF|nr:redox-regulated ATPase YchF [Blastocatellia bacterium]MBK6428301.1 redox-regulated ATPase YchF [Blastocatellia bacterium]
MKVGIVGFAGSGKTTVFNTLTGLQAEVGYGSKDKANLGIIKVPDDRIDRLGELYEPKKLVYAEISFIDIAGPEGERHGGEQGLDPRIVQHMREADALVHVIRAFESPLLSSAPDPVRDLGGFEEELILTDLVQIEKRIERLKKERDSQRERDLMERCHEHLLSEQPLRTLEFTPEERTTVAGFRFLSLKPLLLLLNVNEDGIAGGVPAAIADAAAARSLDIIAMCGRAEMDISQLSAEEQAEFLSDLGIAEPARDRFVQAAYRLLNLISFLTAGPDECRAWPIPAGTTAHRAAGTIHTDIEKRFIKANVVRFEDLVELGSIPKAKEAGKLRIEGKEYVVHDGDVIEFQHNA